MSLMLMVEVGEAIVVFTALSLAVRNLTRSISDRSRVSLPGSAISQPMPPPSRRPTLPDRFPSIQHASSVGQPYPTTANPAPRPCALLPRIRQRRKVGLAHTAAAPPPNACPASQAFGRPGASFASNAVPTLASTAL